MISSACLAAAACAVSALGFAASASSAPEPAIQRAGIYSDLAYIPEAGDLLGVELMLVPSGTGQYVAFVQLSEGEVPFTALIPAQVNNGSIAFGLSTYPGTTDLRFEGTFTSDGINGRWFSDTRPLDAFRGGEIEHLKRGRSYWEQR